MAQCKAHLQSLSTTRWSRRSDATKDLKQNYKGIYQALLIIGDDESQKADLRQEAHSLAQKMTVFENAFMPVFWHFILNRFDSVSKYIQKVELDLCTANDMLLSLVDFVKDMRNNFSKFEEEAENLGDFVITEYLDAKKRKITKKLPDGSTTTESLTGADKFRVDTYYVIIDKLTVELKKRS